MGRGCVKGNNPIRIRFTKLPLQFDTADIIYISKSKVIATDNRSKEMTWYR